MKKFLTLICAFVISLTACLGLVACGGNSGSGAGNGGDKPTPPAPAKTELTYSAMNIQEDAILEVAGGVSDIAVVEKAVFDYYQKTTVDTSVTILSGNQFSFNQEGYVMACKEGTNVAEYINAAMYYFQSNEITVNYSNYNGEVDCKMVDIASDFGLSSDLITIEKPSVSIEDEPEADSEFERILVDGFKIGIVNDVHKRVLNNYPFAGDSHVAGNDGFEILLIRAIARAYGLTIDNSHTQFIKYADCADAIANGTVDVLIGGFSAEGWGAGFDFTVPYYSNSYVLVIRTEDAAKYTTFASMKDATFTAAAGSVGETLIKTGAIKTAVLG